MPEPSPGGCAGGKTRRPQPRPRLSLVLTKDDAICPRYENVEKDRKTLQDEEEGGDGEGKEDEDDMATRNQSLSKGTIIRRSTLPVPLSATASGVTAAVTRPARIQTSFLHHTFKVAAAPSPPAQSTIRCMPYNSPKLAKSSRFVAPPPVARNGHQVGDCQLPKRIAKRAVVPSAAKLHRSEENLIRGGDIAQSPATTAPSLRKPSVAWQKKRVPASLGSTGSISDGSTSAESLAGGEAVVAAGGRKTEFRKSASIPPLLVANLTNQFNALIERSQNTQQRPLASGRAKTRSLVSAGDGDCQTNGLTVVAPPPPNPVVAVRSCPSSPLRRSVFRIGRSEAPATEGVAGFGKVASVAQTVSKERVPQASKEVLSRLLVAGDSGTPATSDIGDVCHKLTAVQRAIRNFEVTLTKSTSSPELPRKKTDSVAITVVRRQSQTLPSTNARPPTETAIRPMASRTLPPLLSCKSARPPTASDKSAIAVVPRLRLQQDSGGRPDDAGTAGSRREKWSVPLSPPVAALRTSILSQRQNGTGIYQNRANLPNVTRIPVKCPTGDEHVFRAKPAVVVVDKIQDRKLPDVPAPGCDGAFRKRSTEGLAKSVSAFSRRSDASSATASDGASLESADSRDSMDLLAEIDSDPQMIAAVSLKTWSQPSVLRIPSPKTVAEAPNSSFLWKASTQYQVKPSVAGRFTNGVQPSGSKESLTGPCQAASGDSDDDDHVYEELFNCLSVGSVPLPPRDDDPLALPKADDDRQNVPPIRRSLESGTTDKTSSSHDVASDGSWTDESDDDTEDDEAKSATLLIKSRARGKKTSGRKLLSRRSWSQSLRDLAQTQDGDAKGHTDGEGTCDEEMGSDSSSDHIYTEPVQNDDREPVEIGAAPDAFATTDTDSDKSPTSATSGSVPDVTKVAHGRESHKGKRLKRNWSWSKTDFHLDLAKLGRIRMHRKSSEKGVAEPSPPADVSPTKKKQWPFKGKAASKKGEKAAPAAAAPPKKESALFYVPTVNADGSLASPPDHMADLDFQVPAEADRALPPEPSGVTAAPTAAISDAVAPSAAAAKKARRISSGGSVSRPKTAPPAPPVFAVKFTPPPVADAPAGKQQSTANSVCSESSTEPVSSLDGSRSRSISPAHKLVQWTHSDQSDSSSTKYCRREYGAVGSVSVRRSASSVSSDSEVMVTVMNRFSKTRVSVGSSHSGSSGDSYIQMDDVVTVPGNSAVAVVPARGDVTNCLTQAPPTIPEDSVSLSSTLKDNSAKGFLYLDDTYFIDDDRNLKLSPFDDEPLYQFYNMAAQQRAAHENQLESSDEDFYESPYQRAPSEASVTTVTSVPSAMELVKSTCGGLRTLWCEVPEVIASGILDGVSSQQRKLQEAIFEVITSEASYLKSLNVLVNHFMLCPHFMDDYSLDCVLNRREKYVLFSDVIPVKETSERLLAALETRWQENIFITDICDILQEHATKHFEVYVKYCSNQIYQDRCLKNLKETCPQFVEVLRRLETGSTCQGLSMYSFLMLPMQRITRMPLLVDAIFNRLQHGTKQFETCKQALTTLYKIVHECNEGATRMARMEEMMILSRQLDFRDFKGVALISASRWLVKKGELTRLIFAESAKLPFGRRCTKQNVYLFLFTDLLIVTKKKSDDCYNVVDYCPRNMVQVAEIDLLEQLPDRPPDGCKNLFQLCMLQNHDNKTVEMFFCCPMESDRTRWTEAVTPKKSENPDERIYEEWDCPQVQAIHPYSAQQPDELSLEESDVVNVFRKMADGWYQGERIRDGVAGWFPSNYTVEIVSSHVRARNLRQRYRILALSQSYLDEQWKKENKGK